MSKDRRELEYLRKEFDKQVDAALAKEKPMLHEKYKNAEERNKNTEKKLDEALQRLARMDEVVATRSEAIKTRDAAEDKAGRLKKENEELIRELQKLRAEQQQNVRPPISQGYEANIPSTHGHIRPGMGGASQTQVSQHPSSIPPSGPVYTTPNDPSRDAHRFLAVITGRQGEGRGDRGGRGVDRGQGRGHRGSSRGRGGHGGRGGTSDAGGYYWQKDA